jgi:hypothetical protein
MATLRPELQTILESLLARNERVLGLNIVADHIGVTQVSAADIDALFDALEAQGSVIGDPDAGPASAHLGTVLATARQLKAELGRAPNVAEIAQRSGLSSDAVRLALLFVKVAQNDAK